METQLPCGGSGTPSPRAGAPIFRAGTPSPPRAGTPEEFVGISPSSTVTDGSSRLGDGAGAAAAGAGEARAWGRWGAGGHGEGGW